jgi:hypothetical protein
MHAIALDTWTAPSAAAAKVIVICYGCAGSRRDPKGGPCRRCGGSGVDPNP